MVMSFRLYVISKDGRVLALGLPDLNQLRVTWVGRVDNVCVNRMFPARTGGMLLMRPLGRKLRVYEAPQMRLRTELQLPARPQELAVSRVFW